METSKTSGQLTAPSSSLRPPVATPQRSRRVLAETLAVLVVTVALGVVANLVPSIGALPGAISLVLPIVYLLVERRVRHRSWAEVGIRRHGFAAGVRANWWLFVLVVLVLQAVSVGLARAFWPGLLTHVSGRIPAYSDLPVLIALIVVLTFREELVYRGLFQERIGWFVGQIASVVGVSALFALTHVSVGVVAVVAVDLLFVFFDSLVYGAIYSRSHNVFVSWAAHAGADLVGLALLLWAATGT
jgi:membrane protease YdiL (CAAX protease family)